MHRKEPGFPGRLLVGSLLVFGGIGTGALSEAFLTGSASFLGLIAFPLALALTLGAWFGASGLALGGKLLTRSGRGDINAAANSAERTGSLVLLLIPAPVLITFGFLMALFGHGGVLKALVLFGVLGLLYGVALHTAAKNRFITLDWLSG